MNKKDSRIQSWEPAQRRMNLGKRDCKEVESFYLNESESRARTQERCTKPSRREHKYKSKNGSTHPLPASRGISPLKLNQTKHQQVIGRMNLEFNDRGFKRKGGRRGEFGNKTFLQGEGGFEGNLNDRNYSGNNVISQKRVDRSKRTGEGNSEMIFMNNKPTHAISLNKNRIISNCNTENQKDNDPLNNSTSDMENNILSDKNSSSNEKIEFRNETRRNRIPNDVSFPSINIPKMSSQLGNIFHQQNNNFRAINQNSFTSIPRNSIEQIQNKSQKSILNGLDQPVNESKKFFDMRKSQSFNGSVSKNNFRDQSPVSDRHRIMSSGPNNIINTNLNNSINAIDNRNNNSVDPRDPRMFYSKMQIPTNFNERRMNQNMNQNLFPMTDDRVNLNDSKFIREMYHRNEQRMNLFDPLNSRNDMLYNNGMANMPRDYINYNNNNKDYMDSNPRSRNYMSHDTHMTAERNRKKSENERIDNNMMESIEIIELGQYKRYRKLLAYLISLFVKGQARANSLDLNDEDLQILKIIIYRKFKKHVDIK